ncbi:uncharacterized protein N7511_004671 [Penicillium nucicola]|uniref:uncharacterized protein n=1 Tax=Penicillium nucicola TaxID=1850975 RepID=UPI002545AF4C|nr:uncharacterized protein N7511_004671 [Penicillium nucicola]KAJ5767055.1 hypothetical protein N7511_004671 [Penicillium nucicola]
MSYTFNDDTHGSDITHLFPERVQGKTFILSGFKKRDLVAATADALAAAGAGIIICTGHCQTEARPIIDHINRKYKKVNMVFVTADTGSLASVQEAGHAIKRMGLPINGFVGFPSVMAVEWEKTRDGFETHFQRNYLCLFLLLKLVSDCMAPGSRVVLVTSTVRTDVRAPTWFDVGFSNGKDYHCLDGYAQSSTANILFAKTLSNMYRNRPIVAFSANPGNTKTNIQTYVTMDQVNTWLERKKIAGEEIPKFRQQAPKSLSQGSATVLRGLLDPGLEDQPGAFLDACQPHNLPHLDFPAGEESATALWRRSEEFLEAFFG